jgi:antitoxin (DNA-binding transcriptional repressor) of toxin-antitoxin stability system
MRELDRGESFIVTRNGAPVAELRPATRRQFVPKEAVLRTFAGAGRIDSDRFRVDIDRYIDQDPKLRA